MLSGDNGILQKATDAKTNTDNAQIKERIKLAYNSAFVEGHGNINEETFKAELKSEFGEEKITDDTIFTSADAKTWIVTIDGISQEVPIVEDSNPASIKKDKNGIIIASTDVTKPFLPTSDTEITNNYLSTGLTIKDSNNNEWVWIVVPKTDKVYKITGVGQSLPAVPDNSENSIYTTIEADLRKYCETDKAGNALITQTDGTESTKDWKKTTAGYVDEYVAGKGTNINSPEKYKEYKQKMLKSVYENGGFYIGKYEAGTETPRGNSNDALTQVVVKQNAYPYNYVSNKQAEDLSETLATGGKTTTLLFGIQWDLVLRHLSEKGMETSSLTSDSSSWGNYCNYPFKLDRGEYSTSDSFKTFISYATPTTDKVSVENSIITKIGTTQSNKILLTSGATDSNCKFNIYDLAGNLSEWTLETNLKTSYACRGGMCNASGSDHPVSSRANYFTSRAISYGSRI